MNDEYQTQKTLIENVQDQQNEEAWKQFIDIYKPFIYSVISKMNMTPSDCEEITQQIIIKLWKSLPDFSYNRTKTKFRSWLFKVIKNHVIDFMRSEKSHSRKRDKVAEFQQTNYENDIDTISQQEWQNHILNLAIEKIKKKFVGNAIEVFTLTKEGKSTSEIMKITKLKESSIHVLRKRVRDELTLEVNKLRKEME